MENLVNLLKRICFRKNIANLIGVANFEEKPKQFRCSKIFEGST